MIQLLRKLGRPKGSGRHFSKYNPPIRTFPHISAATRLRGAEQEPNCEIENPESQSKIRDVLRGLAVVAPPCIHQHNARGAARRAHHDAFGNDRGAPWRNPTGGGGKSPRRPGRALGREEGTLERPCIIRVGRDLGV